MDVDKAVKLIQKYNSGECTAEEKAWVESWYLHQIDQIKTDQIEGIDLSILKDNTWAKISHNRPQQKRKSKHIGKIAIAAAILLAIGVSIYFTTNIISINLGKSDKLTQVVVKPGGNKAYLTLSDGKKIDLSKLKAGGAILQPGMKVLKTTQGQLLYIVENIAKTNRGYNTIETPMGGQFEVNLPDGTKVWLNAASSLKYPINFDANSRTVELSGEGYFEVKSDSRRPFKVLSQGQEVQVLGTHFNINNYRNEPESRTTLLEGKVKISHQNNSKILKPGDQCAINSVGMMVSTVDVEQAIAWHKGDFAFEGAKLKTIMGEISRWYNVEVVYEGNIGDVKFGGSISRQKNIDEVLRSLQMTQGVKFKLEGRRVWVMP